jgi:hypothetical protein
MIVDGKELQVRMNGKTYHCALDITEKTVNVSVN